MGLGCNDGCYNDPYAKVTYTPDSGGWSFAIPGESLTDKDYAAFGDDPSLDSVISLGI
jgi:hypothetical protein